MKHKWFHRLLLWLTLALMLPPNAVSQDKTAQASPEEGNRLRLVQATMCETVTNGKPVNAAVVFSTHREGVSCFTVFDPVPEETFVYHKWFHRDKAIARIKLSLKPPRWSTYSSIHLRESDKGPWRVEIVNRQDRRLETLRFSITD